MPDVVSKSILLMKYYYDLRPIKMSLLSYNKIAILEIMHYLSVK
jgi:hypothetical protein